MSKKNKHVSREMYFCVVCTNRWIVKRARWYSPVCKSICSECGSYGVVVGLK